MEQESDPKTSCALATVYGYLVLGPGDTDQDEQNARQEVELYARKYLNGSALRRRVDRLTESTWDSPFPRRPVAAKLVKELQPGDAVVFLAADRSTARPWELRELLEKWLPRGVQFHFGNLPPIKGLSADQMGPLALYCLQLMKRFRAERRRPRKKSRSKRRSSQQKPRVKKPSPRGSTHANQPNDGRDPQPPRPDLRPQDQSVSPGPPPASRR
jgi:hypothetical protein